MSVGNNGKVLTVGRKLAKILTDSRKSHHPIETLEWGLWLNGSWGPLGWLDHAILSLYSILLLEDFEGGYTNNAADGNFWVQINRTI